MSKLNRNSNPNVNSNKKNKSTLIIYYEELFWLAPFFYLFLSIFCFLLVFETSDTLNAAPPLIHSLLKKPPLCLSSTHSLARLPLAPSIVCAAVALSIVYATPLPPWPAAAPSSEEIVGDGEASEAAAGEDEERSGDCEVRPTATGFGDSNRFGGDGAGGLGNEKDW